MGQRTEKLKLQTDLQKLQSYRTHMESFKTHQQNKATALSDELEAASMSYYVESEPLYQKTLKVLMVFFFCCILKNLVVKNLGFIQIPVNTCTIAAISSGPLTKHKGLNLPLGTKH